MAVTPIFTESTHLVRQMDVSPNLFFNTYIRILYLSYIYLTQVKRRNCIFSDEKNVENAEITAFKTYSQVLSHPTIFTTEFFISSPYHILGS